MLDSVVVGFYCLGAMDLLGILDEQTKETDRDGWREWIWSQQLCSYVQFLGCIAWKSELTEAQTSVTITLSADSGQVHTCMSRDIA